MCAISTQTYLLIDGYLNGLNNTIVSIPIPEGSASVEMRADQHGQTPVWIVPGGVLNDSFSALHLKVIPQTVAWTPGTQSHFHPEDMDGVHFPEGPSVPKRNTSNNITLWPHKSFISSSGQKEKKKTLKYQDSEGAPHQTRTSVEI